MRIVKNLVKVFSILHIVFWLVLLIGGVIELSLYDSTGKESFEIFLDQGFLAVLIVGSGFGAACASMLAVSIFRFFKNTTDPFKRITLAACTLSNLLIYLSAYALFVVNKDGISLYYMAAWLISSIICLLLLAIDSWSKKTGGVYIGEREKNV